MARQLSKILKKSRALVSLSRNRGKLALSIPAPVQAHIRKARRPVIILLEVAGGMLVLCGVLFALLYGRLSQGPVTLTFLVPSLEESINRELIDHSIKIDDFTMEKSGDADGLSLRLRNIRLLDRQGETVAQAPAAAIGLSGRALLSGRIAPGSVDFIGPRLLLFHTKETGLSLTFSRGEAVNTGITEAQGRQVQPEKQATKSVRKDQSGAASPPALKPGIALIAPSRQINLTRTITSAFGRARRKEDASSYLTRFGIRDAFVIFDQNGKQSFWQVPDFSIDLEHRQKRSTILGNGSISSATGPWKFSFRTEEKQKRRSLTFKALVEGLIPSGIAANFPDIPALQAITLPLGIETDIHLTTDGELVSAETKLRLSQGYIIPPWDRKRPILIDAGELSVRYQAKDDRVEILPSTIRWGRSRITVSGEFTPLAGDEPSGWSFSLQATDSILEAYEFGLPPMKIKKWVAKGVYYSDLRRLDLSRFIIQLDGGSIELAGSISDVTGSPGVRLSGRISPMSMAVLKQLWPKFIAAGAREFVGDKVLGGQLSGGKLEINMPADVIAQIGHGGDIPDSAFQLTANINNMKLTFIPGLPPLQTGDAVLRISGRKFSMTVPEGQVVLPSGKRVALEKGKFQIDDLRPDPQTGIVDFQMKGSATSVLELLDHKPLEYAKAVGLRPGDLGGKATGRFKLVLPMISDLEFADIKLDGAAQINEARATKAFGKIGIEGGSVELSVTEKAMEAKGDILLNGVPALLSWQRIFGAPPERQPELRLTTILNAASRKQLGLGVNHILRGSVPMILAQAQGPDGKPKYRVRADLGNADLVLAAVGWRKPPGTPAILSFDIGEGDQGNTELQNFKVEGRDIGIEGWISLGAGGKPKAFYFPDFSFNVITRMEIAGELNKQGIWDIQAHGAAYDGRQFFKSLFSAGKLGEGRQSAPHNLASINLTAKIGAVIGSFNTTVSGVSVVVQKRKGKLSSLNMTGKIQGKSPIAARLISRPGQPRVVLAESEDAGAAFRLIGFYPRVEGGKASLQVNLDAPGAAGGSGTAGILWAKDFYVLGDKVVSEVVASGSESQAANFGEQKKKTGKRQRQKIKFDQMRVPFSVGGGIFNLYDSYINGPQIGATIRGKVNFNTRKIDLGGTYIPVYGLNSALGSIPIIGNLLVGRKGEGVLGITFAVKGSTAKPDVRINPVSAVAPGIFRQIFEYTGRAPKEFRGHQQPPFQQPARPRAQTRQPSNIGSDYQN